MRRTLTTATSVLGLALGLLAAPTAWAQDDWETDDDFSFGDEEPEEDAPERLETEDDLDVDETGDEALEDFENTEDDEDLLGDDGVPKANDSGDSPSIYREAQDANRGAAPDDEILAWEEYLQTYPNSAYRDRITKRVAELEAQMYKGGDIVEETGPIDAMDQEIHFSHPLQLENIDPRTRLQLGVEWGLPSYVNLFVDYEHQIARTFSFHIGARRRFTGYSIEPGIHWALVKSAKTDTLVTVILDAHVNTIPTWVGVRPQLAIGKRFGAVDLQIQGGPDMELRSFDVGMPVRIVGGASATYDASDTVKVFLETGVHMKQLTRDGGSFRYNTATFGMKFFPKKDKRTDQQSDDVEVNMGASVPYTYNYWTYHFGSVMVQSNLYL